MSKIRDIRVKPPVPEIGKRTMSMQHRAAAQEAILLINHHKSIVQQIESGLAAMLVKEYGINISTSDWQINFATGEIAQVKKPAIPEQGEQGRT
jgi:hypothetical protein